MRCKIDLLTVLILSIVLAAVSCNTGRRKPEVRSGAQQWVGVAGFTWDQHEEQDEINQLLTTNGVRVLFDGSIHVGAEVPQEQVELAIALLKTNHLVTTGKVLLLTK